MCGPGTPRLRHRPCELCVCFASVSSPSALLLPPPLSFCFVSVFVKDWSALAISFSVVVFAVKNPNVYTLKTDAVNVLYAVQEKLIA